MTFAKACCLIEEDEINKEMEIEIKNAAHNNRSAFHKNMHRARSFFFNAEERKMRFAALAFLLSRKRDYGNTAADDQEEKELRASMIASGHEEDIARAEKGVNEYGWWLNSSAV